MTALVALAVATFSDVGIARAQATSAPPVIDKSFEVQLFQTAIGPKGFLTVDSATVPAHLQWGAGLMLNYQTAPFKLSTVLQNDSTEQSVDVVKSQSTGELKGAIGILGNLQLGLALPISFSLDGEQSNATGGPAGMSISGGGVGDPRIEGKYAITHARFGEDGSDGEAFVAVSGGLTVPLGDNDKYLGDKTVTGRVKLIGEYRYEDLRAGGYVGALLRDKSQAFAAVVSHQLLYALAAEYFFHPQVGVVAELFGRNGFSKYVDEAPMEVDAALRVGVTPFLTLTGGIGTGVLRGIGAPEFRGFVGADFYPDFRDADQDSVYDANDRCPDDKEDKDGYKDHDGCPELDNDGDTLFDAEDKCPDSAEDLDQFEDEDGCPESDNDKDGVPDLNDPCPNAAEDGAGKRPKDGCPSTTEDTDGDGTPDATDRCPEEPEDRDGFEDNDGCPDLDNDADSIPDQFDTCPSEAEDADGFEDEDGCPEVDNDKDGFPDASDQCPAEPETLNGNKDTDGCTDPGADVVVLGDGVIEVRERIVFKRAELDPTSEPLVNLVGLVLKGHPEIASVRIDVAAGSDGEATARGNAVKNALVAKGVDAARIKVAGKVGRNTVDFVVVEVKDSSAGGAGK